MLYNLSLGNYNRKFKPTKTPYDWLSRDEKRDRAFGDDPLTELHLHRGRVPGFLRGES